MSNKEINVDLHVIDSENGRILPIPKYQTEGSVGMDLIASESVYIPIGKVAMVPTGIEIAIPEGYEAQIRCRSSLAAKGIMVMNGIGTIDVDFRDQIKVLLGNFAFDKHTFDELDNPREPGFQILQGDRIAQIVFAPVVKAKWNIVEKLNPTKRTGGFGSTGV